MAWSRLAEQASEVASGRDSARVANLAIAAQIAARRGHYGRRDALSGDALPEAISSLALSPLKVDERHASAWRQLACTSREAADVFASHGSMDTWVQAFQGGDGARKSRGAYATPQPLAQPMAQLLLRTSRLPHRILDPSAGAGGLLVAVLRELLRVDPATGAGRHACRLYGVELDAVARELCCLLIWLECWQELELKEIAQRIVVGNAVTRDWWSDELYDAVIMNPPWDSLRHQTSASVDADLQRTATLARLCEQRRVSPSLPPLYSAHGRGDRNLYKAFVELVPHLVTPGARVVLLIPGAWSSDLGTRDLRRAYVSQLAIEQWTSFENLSGYFPIDGRYKFGILVGVRSDGGTSSLSIRAFATDANAAFEEHVRVSRAELDELGGDASTIPDLTSTVELGLMLKFKRVGIPFFDPAGPFGAVRYVREVDLTLDRQAGAFHRTEELDVEPCGDGTWITSAGQVLVPLMEGRMVGQYDFHQKCWVAGSGRSAEWSYANGTRLDNCRPQYLIQPVSEHEHRVAICDVTSATNTRTVLATWVPPTWRCGNTAPVLVFPDERAALGALAVLNTMVFDWIARRVVSGLHLNRFYLQALNWPRLSEDDVGELAAAAAALQQLTPRYGDLKEPKIQAAASPLPYVEAHALIESVVARGYGLRHDELALIYTRDKSDRRGFWRHFAADPHAEAIAVRALELFAERPVDDSVGEYRSRADTTSGQLALTL